MKKLLLIILAVTLSVVMSGQSRVTGKVSDNSGNPVIGATVFVKGTMTAVSTDLNGDYAINAKGSDVLRISCIGYNDAEVSINNRSIVNVLLDENIETLEGVVVTGYQTISKERATGSFDIVKKAQLEKPTGNIASRLIGAAAGLAYTEDIYGNPSFTIRGTSSFSASEYPLIVIDGFATENGLESINPNDVESITILKDAAAASIWGAKSANGVIVVTTKNAKASEGKSKVTVDYSGFYKISPKLDLDYTLSEAPVDDVIDYEVNMFNRGDSSVWSPDYAENKYRGAPSTVYNLLNEVKLGHMTQQEANSRINALRSCNNYGQVKEYLLQNASTHQENLSVNVATERSKTTISLLYQNDDRVYKKSDMKKYMINFRNQTKLFKWLDFMANGTYNYSKSNNSAYGMSGMAPYEMLVDGNGNLNRYSGGVLLNYLERHVPMEIFPYQDWTFNPIEEMNNREYNTYSTLARIQTGLTFKIIQGLTIDLKTQYELTQSRTHNYDNENTFYVRDMVNSSCTWDQASGSVKQNLPSGGILSQNHTQRDVLTLRSQVNFNRTFAEKHSVAAIAGIETIDNIYQTFGNPTTYGYNDATLSVGTFPNGAGGSGNLALKNWQGSSESFSYTNSFSYTTDRYFSAFANASYTYDNKYTISGSARTDASNLITDDPKYRYAPFWSVGASWHIYKEDFMKSIDWLDVLTLRATYGHNGNVDKSTTFKPLVSRSASPNLATNEYTSKMSSYGNPTLRWERTGTFDLGADFSALDGKIRGKVDVYNKHSFDLIASRTLAYVQGTSKLTLNNGEISNKGFEIELGSTLPINKDIVWDGTLTFSYNKNKVLSLKQTPTSAYTLVYNAGTSSAWMEGYDMNTLWCYQYGGIINKGTETTPDWQPTILGKDGVQQTFASWPTGKYENISYEMGTLVAPVNAAFSTSLKVYDFDISMILTGKFGHKFLRESFNYPSISGNSIPNAKYSEIVNCDPNERIPLPMKDDEPRLYFWDRFFPFMSYLCESASLIRLQEFTVAYNLPEAAVNWLGIGGLKLYLQANNPCNFYFNKWNEDPEFPRGSVKLQSTYMFGVKCNF